MSQPREFLGSRARAPLPFARDLGKQRVYCAAIGAWLLLGRLQCLGSNAWLTHSLYKNATRYLKDEADQRHATQDKKRRPWILRSLYATGLFCQHFDFSSQRQKSDDSTETEDEDLDTTSIRDVVFIIQLFFAENSRDEAVRLKALAGLGLLMVRHQHFMVRTEVKELYHTVLTDGGPESKAQVLENLRLVLTDEERRLALASQQDSTVEGSNRVIAEMGGDDAGFNGSLLSFLETPIRDTVHSTSAKLRQSAFTAMKLVLRQGLVHPMEHVAYLISVTTDPVQQIRDAAVLQLIELNDQYPDFVEQKAVEGCAVTFTFKQRLGASGMTELRGYKVGAPEEPPSAVLAQLYQLLRTRRTVRSMFLQSLVRKSRDPTASISEHLFTAGNLAYFPYVVVEEPLFVIHSIGAESAVRGTQLEGQFRSILGYADALSNAEEEDDVETVTKRIGDTVSPELESVLATARSMIVLLQLKRFLQKLYGFSDPRCEAYSPSDVAKTHDAKVFRKEVPMFEVVMSTDGSGPITPGGAAQQYIQFRDLMLTGEYDEFGAEQEDDEAAEDVPTEKKAKKKSGRRQSVKNKPASAKKSTRRGSKKRRKAFALSDSDDDLDEDPDWA